MYRSFLHLNYLTYRKYKTWYKENTFLLDAWSHQQSFWRYSFTPLSERLVWSRPYTAEINNFVHHFICQYTDTEMTSVPIRLLLNKIIYSHVYCIMGQSSLTHSLMVDFAWTHLEWLCKTAHYYSHLKVILLQRNRRNYQSSVCL